MLQQAHAAPRAARGAVLIHSCPPAICQRVEWSVAGVLSCPARFIWSVQPVAPGTFRAECTWTGGRGTAGAIAAALRPWSMLRFEVTEEPSPGCDGERICYVPGRGVFRGLVGANGDFLVGEQQLRHLLAVATCREDVIHRIEALLGAGWDADLEGYRHAGDGSASTWLHQVS